MLTDVSDKAKGRPNYARRTVMRAASAVSQRQGLGVMFEAVLQDSRTFGYGHATA